MNTTNKQQVLSAIKAYEKNLSGHNVDYQITDIIPLPENAAMYQFQADDIRSSAILHSDGTVFVLTDWQGSRPTSFAEVADYDWIAIDGQDAIILNDLPRLF